MGEERGPLPLMRLKIQQNCQGQVLNHSQRSHIIASIEVLTRGGGLRSRRIRGGEHLLHYKRTRDQKQSREVPPTILDLRRFDRRVTLIVYKLIISDRSRPNKKPRSKYREVSSSINIILKEDFHMNKPKVDFSNVFSPKSQRVISKRKGSISPQLSPVKQKVQREFVTNVPVIEGYRQMTKLRLSDANMQNILQTLKIQTEATREHDQRIKNSKLYLNYTHNPLTMIHNDSPPPKQQGNIINAIQKLKKTDLASTIKARITPAQSEIKDLCMKLKKRIEKGLRKVKQQQKENILPEKKSDAAPSLRTKTLIEQLDDITNINQEQYFSKRYTNTERNIFQLINNKNHPNFQSNREVLSQYHFCNDSMWLPGSSQKKTSNKLYLNHMECISSFSREMARGIIPKKLPQKMLLGEGDIGFNLQQLYFDDIMVVATNKLTNKALREFFREEEEDLQKKAKDRAMIQEADALMILYSQNTRNRRDDFNPINQDKTEISYFHQSALTNIEKQQQQLSNQYQAKLKKYIEQEATVRSNTIKDPKVLASFKKKKEKTLIQLLEGNVDQRLTLLMKEVERKIRMNKMNKNRTEKIKIQSLTQSFRMKRALETSANKSKQKKDSRFSPLKTWRG